MNVRRILKWTAVTAPFVAIAIQFVPVDRTNPPVETEVPAPAEARAVLQRACYDCHSNQTVWPWYSKVAPVSWLVARDVHDGRRHVNFSTWNRYQPEGQERRMKEIWEEVSGGDMPLWYYRPLHPAAKLSDADKAIIRQWTASTGRKDTPF